MVFLSHLPTGLAPDTGTIASAAFDAISRGPTHGGCECEVAQSYDDCPETARGAWELGAGPKLPAAGAAGMRAYAAAAAVCLWTVGQARQSRPQLGHGREGRPFGGCASGEGFAIALCRPQPPRSTRGDLGGRGRHNIGPAARRASGAEHTQRAAHARPRGCRDHRGAPADRRQDGLPRGPDLAAAPVSWCPSTATRLASPTWVELGSLTGQAARLLQAAVLAGLNIVVAAGT